VDLRAIYDEAKAALDKLVNELPILPYLSAVKSRISSWARHRQMLLAKIVCANWTTEPAIKTKDSYVVPDPSRFHPKTDMSAAALKAAHCTDQAHLSGRLAPGSM